jgi:hypothetical protein
MSNLTSHHLSRIIQLDKGFEEKEPENGALCFLFPKENPNIQFICSNEKSYENVLHYKNFRSWTIVIIRPPKDFSQDHPILVAYDPKRPDEKEEFNYSLREQ